MIHTPGFLALVKDAKSRIRETDIQTVKRRMDAGESFHLVDVREDNEWERAHLPRSIHLGKGIIERDIERTIPDASAEIILYCGGGYRSALAADNLRRMGYTNVVSMDGGFTAWKNAGFPLESEAGKK